MLQRQYRIPLRRRSYVFQTLSSSLFILKVAQNSLPYSRFGIIISKRVEKKAVKRNMFKRRLSHSIAVYQARIHPGFDFLFLAKKAMSESSQQQVEQEVIGILQKGGYLS